LFLEGREYFPAKREERARLYIMGNLAEFPKPRDFMFYAEGMLRVKPRYADSFHEYRKGICLADF
jgi:hypothetical protein